MDHELVRVGLGLELVLDLIEEVEEGEQQTDPTW